MGDNNDIKKSLVIKDTERKKKIGKNHRLKNISNILKINFDSKDKAKINNTNNNTYKKNKMKKISNNIILFNISRKSFKDKNESNENSIIKINGSIHNSINNINIINISKNKEKHVNNLTQNLYKEKIINYNNNDKCGIMNSYNEYSENRTSRKNTNKESYNSINLTKENVKKKAKLVLFKNIKYRSPLTIKKIRLAINNHNSKKLNKINNNKTF